MKVLLDTHAFLWAATRPERLGEQRSLVSDPTTVRMLSAASSWEIAIKYALGRLPLPEPPRDYVPDAMQRLVVAGLAIEHEHTLAVADLPVHHRDPFDRLLVAQAQQLDVPIVSADPVLTRYEVDILPP